jgi:cobalt-zinc-cadmium efflux system outer membrane protein
MGIQAQGRQTRTSVDYAGADGYTVGRLVDLALAQNADLLAARQEIAATQGLLVQSGLRPNPTMDFSAAGGSVLNNPGEREFSVGYSHVFELGDKRQHRVNAGRLRVELSRLDAANRERLLQADVKNRFADGLAAIAALESAEQLLELNRQSLRIASVRSEKGEGAPLERALVQVEVSRMDSDRVLFANRVERALLDLATLAGIQTDDLIRIHGSLAVREPVLSLTEAKARAMEVRPDLRAARLEMELGEAELQLARSQAVPDLIASGRYSRAASRFDQFGLASPGGPPVPLRDVDNMLAAGISFQLPSSNRNQGNIQAALARRQAAHLRSRFLEQGVVREVEAAYNRYRAARQALGIFDQEVLKQAEDNVRVLRSAYELGELRLLDVINEQRRLVEIRKAYTDILGESYHALVELERAVGEPLF